MLFGRLSSSILSFIFSRVGYFGFYIEKKCVDIVQINVLLIKIFGRWIENEITPVLKGCSEKA